jgi:hypothetical protein
MNWLSDLADHNRLSMLGVAKAAAKDELWPGPTNPTVIATALRDANRGTRTAWLLDHPARFAVVARVLKVPEDDLRHRARQATAPSATRLPLLDLPEDARPLDLVHEDLFPGIPEAVQFPERWSAPTWWTIEPGAGEGVVEAWHRARGVEVFRCGAAAEAVEHLGNGPLFVVADRPDGAEAVLKQAARQSARVCVACNQPPPESNSKAETSLGSVGKRLSIPIAGVVDPAAPDEETGQRRRTGDVWTMVSTAPFDDWGQDLLAWVVPRLSERSCLRSADAVAQARDFLDQVGEAMRTPADVFTYCTMLDEHPFEDLDDGSAVSTAWALIARRIRGDDHVARWLRDRGDEVLRAIIARVGSTTDHDCNIHTLYGAGIDRASWERLIDGTVVPEADPDQLRTALERGHEHSPAEAMRLLSPPTPKTLISKLAESGLLIPSANGALRWRFAWVLALFYVDWTTTSAAWAATTWGEALLRPWQTATLHEVLANQLQEGRWEIVALALDGFDAHDLASVAFLEACFRNVGLRLADRNDIPAHLITSLWRAQRQTLERWYEGDWPPLPRVSHVSANPSAERLSNDAFLVAAGLLAEAAVMVGAGDEVEPELHLDPDLRGPSAVAAAIGRINGWTRRDNEELLPWADAWFHLVSRVVARCPDVLDHAAEHGATALQAHRVVRLIGSGGTKDGVESPLPNTPFRWVQAACELAQVDIDAVIDAAWTAEPLTSGIGRWWACVLAEDEAFAREQWGRAPSAAIERALLRNPQLDLPAHRMSAASWNTVLSRLHDMKRCPLLDRIPWSVLEDLLCDPSFHGKYFLVDFFPTAWARHREPLQQLLASVDHPSARPWSDLLALAPPDVLLAFAKLETHRVIVRRAILHRIGDRGPGWRDLWRALGADRSGENLQR